MRTCQLEGCDNGHDSKGYCPRHYQAIFINKKHQCKESGCLNFTKDHDYCYEHRGCIETNCKEPHMARGYCVNHYYVNKSSGKLKDTKNRVCKIENCDNRFYAKDYCRNHHARFHLGKTRKHYTEECKSEICVRTTTLEEPFCCRCRQRIDKGLPLDRKAKGGAKGARNVQWKGGVAEYKDHHTMKKMRLRKLAEVGCKCEHCGVEKPRNKLAMHHLDGSKDNHAYENFLLLCHKCHMGIYHKGKPRKPKKRFNGLTYEDITNRVGCSKSTVINHILNHQISKKYGNAINELTMPV